MKKIIFLNIVALFTILSGISQVTTITGASGTFGINQSQYVNDMNRQFNINTNSSQCVQLTITHDIEYDCDYIQVYECDNNFGSLVNIAYIYDSGNTIIKSHNPNGKLVLIFTSDGSGNGIDDGYTGFSVNYTTSPAPANVINSTDPVKIESYATTPNITVTDYALKNMGSVSSVTTDYNKSMILLKSGYSQLGLGANKISANGNLGISASYLYQTAHSFYFSTPGLSNILTINGNGITAGTMVYLKREHLAFSNPTGHACIYFGNAGAGDLWIRRTSTAGNLTPYADLVIIKNNGNVGIGTTDPGTYKLNVAGSIRANEIKVNTTGADFVFAPNYKLRPLSEVESFIKQNQHLPEITPAKEMQADGVNISELQTKLLQKVEELTLYLIEQQKQLVALKLENEKLKKKVGLE